MIPSTNNMHFDPGVYWMLPTPHSFATRLIQVMTEGRWASITIPNTSVHGINDAIEDALIRIQYETQKIVWLKIEEGMTPDREVGSVFDMGQLPALDLATQTGPVSTIVMQAIGDTARMHCQEYLDNFIKGCQSINRPRGVPRLLVLIRKPLHDMQRPESTQPHDIIFSGALSRREMLAYVNIRTDRTGPGSIPLLPALIAEFSGYDPLLADQLIQLPDEAVLDLPRSLTGLLEHDLQRWRAPQWASGSVAEVDCKLERHALHLQHLASHPGDQQNEARSQLQRLYLRACTQAILPWLESNRRAILKHLTPTIRQFLQPTGGKLQKRDREIEPEELEYNNVVGLVYAENMRIPNDPISQAAFRICCVAKAVRDEISHLRCPPGSKITELAERMDAFIASTSEQA